MLNDARRSAGARVEKGPAIGSLTSLRLKLANAGGD